MREWWEVSHSRIGYDLPDRKSAAASGRKWFPYAKGGDFRRWAGNLDAVVNWENDGRELQTTLTSDESRVRATNFNLDRILKPGIAWTVVTSSKPSFRAVGPGFLFADAAGICQSRDDAYVLALLNSSSVDHILQGLNPTINLQPGNLSSLPLPEDRQVASVREWTQAAIAISESDWNLHERSWGFRRSPLVRQEVRLEAAYTRARLEWQSWTEELRIVEEKNNDHFASLYRLDAHSGSLASASVSITVNPNFLYSDVAENGPARRYFFGTASKNLFLTVSVACSVDTASTSRG